MYLITSPPSQTRFKKLNYPMHYRTATAQILSLDLSRLHHLQRREQLNHSNKVEMKVEEAQTIATTATTTKKEVSDGGLLGRGRYKFWALAAILLLAFWSMLTGTVTLKWSAGNLNPVSDDFDLLIPDDLDVLELEEREKVVRHMWDVYTHSSTIRLPRFWQEAFEAAYEDLTSDVPVVRDAAVSEIAKMSLWSVDVEPPPVLSKTRERKISKKVDDKKVATTTSGTS